MISPWLMQRTNAERTVCRNCDDWEMCPCIGGCEKCLEYLEALEDEDEYSRD